MNPSTLAKCIGIAAVSVFLCACRKFDLKFRDPAQHCRIDEFRGAAYKGEDFEMPVVRKFHYNEYGNPTLVEYLEIGDGTGFPNAYFYYNDKQQLIRFECHGSHLYFYNELGQIAIDSSYEHYAGGDARYETRFYYDLYGRVVKITRKYYYDAYPQDGLGETTTGYIKYDQRGNRIRNGVTYDNKTSMYRTHPLWMFLHLDYSINNGMKATTYNNAGLPLTFNDYIDFLESGITTDSAIYDCNQGNN
jgi:hypothetical protein